MKDMLYTHVRWSFVKTLFWMNICIMFGTSLTFSKCSNVWRRQNFSSTQMYCFYEYLSKSCKFCVYNINNNNNNSENFLIFCANSVQNISYPFLKIRQISKDGPKIFESAWKTNKNFLSNFVDLSQYWKFLNILGNPDVISYKKIS